MPLHQNLSALDPAPYWTHLHCELGWLRIAGDESGLTSIFFADHDPGTTDNLPAHLPTAVTQIQEYLAGMRREFDLPLRPAGTDFQIRVWNALHGIPYGATCSYRDVAQALRNEKAVRAVGAANGRNPLSIVVPCHRVIGANGKLTGYGGKIWRKKWLLEHERSIRYGAQTTLF
ncbi:MAG: methylated-DNA--[protein]-cysteine S-methyltransferase [Bacteroidota bacterium]